MEARRSTTWYTGARLGGRSREAVTSCLSRSPPPVSSKPPAPWPSSALSSEAPPPPCSSPPHHHTSTPLAPALTVHQSTQLATTAAMPHHGRCALVALIRRQLGRVRGETDQCQPPLVSPSSVRAPARVGAAGGVRRVLSRYRAPRGLGHGLGEWWVCGVHEPRT